MAEQVGNPTIQFLTDDMIALYSQDNVLTEWRDINANYTTRIEPWANGVLDKKIFGSIFSEQCNCGKVRSKGMLCHSCGARVNDDIEAYKRFARIELPVYYCAELKFKQMASMVKNSFSDIKFEFASEMFKNAASLGNPKVFDICQFSYDQENDTLIVTDEIDDYTKCSYEGLIQIFMKYKSGELTHFTSYINSSILVVPIIMRPPVITYMGGNRRWKMHYITSVYQNIIYAIHNYYEDVDTGMESNEEHALLRACIRRFVTKAMSNISSLMRTSKQNLARNMSSVRIPNSGRCTIIPGPDLKIDEVRIPRHLMYEACREEFTKFISQEFGTTLARADFLYRTQPNSDEIQKLFDKFVEGDETRKGKYILMNRAPTLHEYNIQCFKVKLTNDYAMSIPLAVCRPFGGDFDGDTMAWYVINDELTDLMIEKMSPQQLIYYKKNFKPIYTPEQDVLSGLLLATKIRRDDDMKTFGSIEEAEEWRKTHRDFKVQTVCNINGEETTIARYRLGEYFGVNLNDAYGIDTPINAKIVEELMCKLASFEDRLDRYKKIQDYALYVVTVVGVTAPSIAELYMDVDNEYLQKIREIEKSDKLTQEEKNITIRELFEKYQEEEVSKIDGELAQKVNDSVRAKSRSLMEIMTPQMNINSKGEVKVAQTTMIEGMSQEDFQNHAIENRNVFDIKNLGVPNGGSLTRQFVFLGAAYSYSDTYDETNTGILVEECKAEGRTTVEGKIVGKSKSHDLIKVRSILSTQLKEKIITKDMISNIVPFNNGDNIGISYISSFTEGMTQSALSLKHGGSLYTQTDNSKLIAPEDCECDDNDQYWIYLITENGDKLKYIKPSNWVRNFSSTNKYKKGEVVGYAYHNLTPQWKLDSIIQLVHARAVKPDKSFANNRIFMSQCYALSDGEIKYELGPDNYHRLSINGQNYDVNEECLYMLPEGTKVKRFDRICDGVLDMGFIFANEPDFIEDYYFFRKQLTELAPGIQEVLYEFLFKLITTRDEYGTAMNGVLNSIHKSGSFFTELSFEDYKKTFAKVDYQGMSLIDDLMTRSNLPLILNNSIL